MYDATRIANEATRIKVNREKWIRQETTRSYLGTGSNDTPIMIPVIVERAT